MRFVWLLFLVGLPLAGQEVQEKIKVVLREVRVHVLDKQGNPIRNLKKENFILEEEGAPQELTFFEETDVISSDAVSPQTDSFGNVANSNPLAEGVGKRRVIVLALDTSDMDRTDFDRVIDDLRGFIAGFTDRDFVKIVQFDDKGRDLVPFTTDNDQLLEGLNLARFTGGLKRKLRALEREIAEEIPGFAQAQSMVNRIDDAIIAVDGRVKGELQNAKVQMENVRNEYALNIDNLVRQKEFLKAGYFRTYYLNMKFLARMLEPVDGPKQVYFLSGGVYLESGGYYKDTEDLAEDLAADLNQARVTVYSVFQPTRKPNTEDLIRTAGATAGLDLGRYLSGVLSGNTRVLTEDGEEIDLSQILGGLGSTAPIINVNQLKQMPSLVAEFTNYTSDIRHAANPVVENNIHMVSGVQQIARDTGGIFARAKNQSAVEALTKIHNASGHYYTLGYDLKTATEKNKSKIAVKVKDVPGKVVLRYGKEIAREQPYQKMEQDEREVAFKAELVFSQVRRMDLQSEWNYALYVGKDNTFRLPVTGTIQLPPGEREQCDIGFAALDAQRDPIDFTFTALERMPERDKLEVYDVLICDRQPEFLRFMVKNPITGSTTIEEIRVSDPGTEIYGTHLSGVMMAVGDRTNVFPLNHIRASAARKVWEQQQTKKKKKGGEKDEEDGWEDDPRVANDPFAIDRHFFRPSATRSFTRPENIDVFFHFANFEDEVPFLDLSMVLQTEDGFKVPRFGMVNMNRQDKTTLHYHYRIQSADLKPGSYRLWIKMIDHNYKSEYKRAATFSIVEEQAQP
ncbi:MAG: VWA domain-containing protein [Acidobacteriota bacterium]|nr:VWA domain-containing protein [Acidobacteriota bacterium]